MTHLHLHLRVPRRPRKAYQLEARKRFNEIIAACHDPVQTLHFLEEKKARMAFAEQQGLRLMATTSAATFINIDYDLSPEPDYKGSLEENGCPEWREWREAREEELAAMRKFGVYRIVSRSEARGHKLLTSKWVQKRKTNEKGEVCRHKARLVARGFAQRGLYGRLHGATKHARHRY